MPYDLSDKVRCTEHLVEKQPHSVHLDVIEMHPDGAIVAEQCPHVEEAVSHHGEPHGVFKRVIVRTERLLGVKRRVDVDQLDLADVLVG